MKIFKLPFLIFPVLIFAQNSLPDLYLKNGIDKNNDVQNLLKLKKNEISVSFYTNGGLIPEYLIDNFIFKQNNRVVHQKAKIFYKKGGKYQNNIINISKEKEDELKKIINSDLFSTFSKYSQADFQYSQNNHQICAKGYIDDAPENFIMIIQNGMQSTIMVYLPKNNINCSTKDSPLMKFIELHRLFGIEIER
ncbi:hypothetical protein [Epilithonimonas sp.]|uniref:hypothetical protein n=1 Tax=Epilithonimonas sp. TaxID=2894511 RepID=UPI0028A0C283|nr:hypothetical protein [Epilithonimonas sp.]